MSGIDILIDTNICIYLLNGDLILGDLVQDQTIYISVITEMELHAYAGNNVDSLIALDNFVQLVNIINFDDNIKKATIAIRKEFKLKLPDSIIAASAITHKMFFITSDKAFKSVTGLDLFLNDFSE